MPLTTYVAGDVLTASSLNNNFTFAAGSGGVVQVKSTTKTDTFTLSSATYTDVTGLSVSITPTSATNKILVLLNINGAGQSGASLGLVQIVRDSTAIGIGDAAGSRLRATTLFNGLLSNEQLSSSGQILDSPATASALTYKIQVRSFSTQLLTVNRGQTDTDSASFVRTASTITVMEVTP